MMSTKKLVVSAAISALMSALMITNTAAQPFLFNPNGTGASGALTADLIDQAPGNALAKGALTPNGNGGFQPAAGTNFELYYQANLSVLKNGGSIVFANGLNNSNYFTFTAAAGEVITSVTTPTAPDFKQTANFALSANQLENFFRIYAATTLGNDLTGLGFTTSTLIYEGRVTSETMSAFTVNGAIANQPLDQFGTNNYPGKTSVTGSGSSTFEVTTTYFNPGYFPSLQNGALILSNVNASTVTPFFQVNPSICFASRFVDCAVTYNIGSNNFTSGPDFLLQTDANQTVSQATAVLPVPEPATPAVLALGLVVMGLLRAFRKNKQA